ncbi:MAG: 4a-hydroxytetrahydrobiopterin dehydratase [Candidatus Pacebacteria bacterium]|nr:4a-hydroxytetrahydrobiopterin dehydratase [Candidatus Paceibacterota bacterium]MBP9840467.1 4a-hydroxytetrahydrobiopterin dehydratase [Candidatus Paceibacterota bacterium]
MSELARRKCVPCEGDFPALTKAQAGDFLPHVPGWEMNVEAKEISRDYTFPDFAEALAFVDKVGALAEEEGHHPDIVLSWGKVGIRLSTHAVKGLSENDFILAAKIDLLD